MLINDKDLTGLKISEMIEASRIDGKEHIPIVQDSFNKKVAVEDLMEMLEVPRLTSDLDNDAIDIAASANAANQLLKKFTKLKAEMLGALGNLNITIDTLSEAIDSIEAGELEVDWSNIINRPTIAELTGPQGPQGIPGIQGIQGPIGPQGPAGTNGTDGNDGINGVDGANGTNSYFHVRWSINADGNPMTQTPSDYIGTYVSASAIAPTNYQLYTWQRIRGAQGEDGTQGIPGVNGADGTTQYLHIKYSNDGGLTFTGNDGEDPGDWLGQRVDDQLMDSMNPADYTWSLIKGEPGEDGLDGQDGQDGQDGVAGAMMMYMGVYSSTESYTGSAFVRHVVKWNNGVDDFYYVALPNVGTFTNIPPNNTLYWEPFQGQFKSIATEMLFAEGANIGGWIFHKEAGDDILESQNSATKLNGTTGEISADNARFKLSPTNGVTLTSDSSNYGLRINDLWQNASANLTARGGVQFRDPAIGAESGLSADHFSIGHDSSGNGGRFTVASMGGGSEFNMSIRGLTHSPSATAPSQLGQGGLWIDNSGFLRVKM